MEASKWLPRSALLALMLGAGMAQAEAFSERGVHVFASASGCPLGVLSDCNRIALDDVHSRVELDRAAGTILFRNTWDYADDAVIGDVTQAAYLGPWLWKAAVEKAGSFDVDKVAAASPGIELTTAPEGYVKVHDNHHLWSKTRVGKAKADGQYEVIYETADLMEPDPFPKGYQ